MKNLSLFHQEILTLLERSAESQGLPFRGGGTVDQAVEQYQSLFDEEGALETELRWMSSFREKEFAILGLSRYFPRIYRGLPRVYKSDDPTVARIKNNFRSLSDLRKRSIDRAIYSLYEGKLVARPWKIGILTWVIADGLGDWIGAQESAHILQERWPELEIHLFPISKKILPDCPDFLTFPICYEGEERGDFVPQSQLMNMDFVLQIPTFFPGLEERDFPIESVGEYGYIESSWFHPKSGRYSMGFHALEKGIFIRKQGRVSFAEIEQKKLLLYLFGTEMPGPIEMDNYMKRVRFHVAYLATPVGGAIYLHTLLKMWERDPLDIDLCSPDPNWIVDWVKMREGEGLPLLERNYGVKEIVVQGPDEEYRLRISSTGEKTVRILSPGLFSPQDMRRLIGLSGEWVGVRGNQSFSEVISIGKPFFYDGRPHAKFFVKDIAAFAENRLGDHKSSVQAFRLMVQAFLWNLPEEEGEWVDEMEIQRRGKIGWFEISSELGSLLQDADTVAGLKKYCRLSSDEKSFNPFLLHLVERGLIHKISPEIESFEKEQVQLYAEGSLPFSSLVKKLGRAIIQI